MNLLKPTALALATILLGASPAFALNCYGAGSVSSPSLNIGLEFRFGDVTEADNAQFDLMRLRRTGVDASSVEYWNGCIRAWVRNEDSVGEHMEFYHPRTLERVYD